jgi:hypothetical protein
VDLNKNQIMKTNLLRKIRNRQALMHQNSMLIMGDDVTCYFLNTALNEKDRKKKISDFWGRCYSERKKYHKLRDIKRIKELIFLLMKSNM